MDIHNCCKLCISIIHILVFLFFGTPNPPPQPPTPTPTPQKKTKKRTKTKNKGGRLSGSTVLSYYTLNIYTLAQRSWRGGILESPCPSVRPSVRPSVCRRHGFRSISKVCFGISISNFICMLMVAIGRSLLIFSDVTFKMAAWRPYWIFWFPDSNFTLALNINFKLQRHNTYVYG